MDPRREDSAGDATRPTLELLTVAEIAKRLGYPESWVLYYSSRYAAYLPGVRLRRGRGYRPGALAVLRFVAERLQQDESAAAIEAALQVRFPVAQSPAPAAAGVAPPEPGAAPALPAGLPPRAVPAEATSEPRPGSAEGGVRTSAASGAPGHAAPQPGEASAVPTAPRDTGSESVRPGRTVAEVSSGPAPSGARPAPPLGPARQAYEPAPLPEEVRQAMDSLASGLRGELALLRKQVAQLAGEVEQSRLHVEARGAEVLAAAGELRRLQLGTRTAALHDELVNVRRESVDLVTAFEQERRRSKARDAGLIAALDEILATLQDHARLLAELGRHSGGPGGPPPRQAQELPRPAGPSPQEQAEERGAPPQRAARRGRTSDARLGLEPAVAEHAAALQQAATAVPGAGRQPPDPTNDGRSGPVGSDRRARRSDPAHTPGRRSDARAAAAVFGGVGFLCGLLSVSALFNLAPLALGTSGPAVAGDGPAGALLLFCGLVFCGSGLWGVFDLRRGDDRRGALLLVIAAGGFALWSGWIALTSWQGLLAALGESLAGSSLLAAVWAAPVAAPLLFLLAGVLTLSGLWAAGDGPDQRGGAPLTRPAVEESGPPRPPAGASPRWPGQVARGLLPDDFDASRLGPAWLLAGGFGLGCGLGSLLLVLAADLALQARGLPGLHLGGLGGGASLVLFGLCYLLCCGAAALALRGAGADGADGRRGALLLALAAAGTALWAAWLASSSWHNLVLLAQATIAIAPVRVVAWALPLATPLGLLISAALLARASRGRARRAPASADARWDGRRADEMPPWWDRAGRWLRAGR